MDVRESRPLGFESVNVDKRSPVPVYLQIADGLRKLIQSGVFPAGCPLPPERVLCESYGVSRMTLRQATAILDQEGLIISHRGRGTFVAHSRLRKQQYELRSFTEEVRARGGRPESRMISFEEVRPSAEAREFFNISEGQKIYQIERLRLDNGIPLALEQAQLPQVLCPWLNRFDLAANSLYRVLEESYGLTLGNCLEEISAAMPSPSERKLLQLAKNAAVLVIRRRTFTDIGQPLELTRAAYNGDLYSAIVQSVRPRRAKRDDA